MVAVATVSVPDILPWLKDLLADAVAAYEQAPITENRRLLTRVEDFIEDLVDLQESAEALREAEESGEVPTWAEVKAELGL